MSQFLGLDVGTQSTKGLVVDLEEGRVVARAARSYGLIEGLEEGAAEQHPDTWWDAVRHVVRTLVAEPAVRTDALAGIGVSGQQHGFVPLDAEGRVIRPAKLWCDTSTAEEARELCDDLVHLPTQGPVSSLNVSNAAAIALYHMRALRDDAVHDSKTDG